MIFEVMIIHFAFEWCQDNAASSLPVWLLYKYEYIGVPVFIFLAFALSDYKEMSVDIKRLRKRMYRLLVPNVFWAVVYFLILSALGIVYHEQLVHGVSDLFWQLLFGHVYNRSLWFQTVLILSTLIVIVLYRFLKDKAFIALFLISVLSLFLQYSGVNGVMFDLIPWPSNVLGGYFSGGYVMYTLGRGIELLPYVFLGTIVGRLGLLQKLINYRWYALMVSFCITILVLSQQIFTVPSGFMYGGLGNMTLAISLIVFFWYLPLEKLPDVLKKGINILAGYTMAVYFMHQLIKWIYVLVFRIPVFEIFNPFLGCAIIYFSCIVIAFLLSHIRIRFIRESMM